MNNHITVHAKVTEVINALDEVNQYMLCELMGINGGDVRPIEEVAVELGITVDEIGVVMARAVRLFHLELMRDVYRVH